LRLWFGLFQLLQKAATLNDLFLRLHSDCLFGTMCCSRDLIFCDDGNYHETTSMAAHGFNIFIAHVVLNEYLRNAMSPSQIKFSKCTQSHLQSLFRVLNARRSSCSGSWSIIFLGKQKSLSSLACVFQGIGIAFDCDSSHIASAIASNRDRSSHRICVLKHYLPVDMPC
jgi:hypothetical protein